MTLFSDDSESLPATLGKERAIVYVLERHASSSLFLLKTDPASWRILQLSRTEMHEWTKLDKEVFGFWLKYNQKGSKYNLSHV